MSLKKNTNHLILASASPRRKQLLESCGFILNIIVPNIEEKPLKNEINTNYAVRNAVEKGLAVSNKLTNKNEFVVSADTIVVTKDNCLLEKPQNAKEAKEMLNKLSQNTHLVYTGYAITQNNKTLLSKFVETSVKFRKLFEDEIESYILSGEPFDKAGGYGIQGAAMGFVEEISGSYTNVCGLPLSHFIEDFRMLNTPT